MATDDGLETHLLRGIRKRAALLLLFAQLRFQQLNLALKLIAFLFTFSCLFLQEMPCGLQLFVSGINLCFWW